MANAIGFLFPYNYVIAVIPSSYKKKLSEMATLQVSQNGKAMKGRTNKALLSVDLTAMVDLAFLLITFFMLTTSLAKMRALDLAKPVPEGEGQWPESRTMTILLGKHNQAVYYMGKGETATMRVTDLAAIKIHYHQVRKLAWYFSTFLS